MISPFIPEQSTSIISIISLFFLLACSDAGVSSWSSKSSSHHLLYTYPSFQPMHTYIVSPWSAHISHNFMMKPTGNCHLTGGNKTLIDGLPKLLVWSLSLSVKWKWRNCPSRSNFCDYAALFGPSHKLLWMEGF